MDEQSLKGQQLLDLEKLLLFGNVDPAVASSGFRGKKLSDDIS